MQRRRRAKAQHATEPVARRRRGWWPRLPSSVIGWAGWSLLVLALAGLTWITVTAVLARQELAKARAELPQIRVALTSGDVAQAESLAESVADHARSAHGFVSGPAWWVGAHLPVVGEPLTTTRTIAASADAIGQAALPSLVTLADLADSPSLRNGNTIDVAALASSEQPISHALDVVHRAGSALAGTPSSTWLPVVDQARSSLEGQLATLQDYLQGATRTLHIVLPALGAEHRQRYFVAFENEAESRGLGGLPGAFAIATAYHGRLRFTHFGSDSELIGTPAHVSMPSSYRTSYGSAHPSADYRNSDISPDFPYAARIWASMWRQHSGQAITGAIAIDPTALGYMLQATGPATAADGTQVSASNVVDLTESRQYALFDSRKLRQAWLIQLSRAIAHKLTGGSGLERLGRAVARAATERRFVVWSRQPAIEKQLVEANYGGVLPTSGPVSSFAVDNAAGNKLDYYLDRQMTYRRTSCANDATVTASLKLTDDAPSHGLPAYVTIRADHPPSGAKPGDNHLIVDYYTTSGAVVTGVTVDGVKTNFLLSSENGLTVVLLDVQLRVGVPVSVSVTTREPPAETRPVIVTQPLARPMPVTRSGPQCEG